MKVINVGIIGYGLSGRIFHSYIIQAIEGFKIKKIYTQNPSKKLQALEEHKDVEVVGDLNEILTDKSIDLVIICTPNTLHAELAKKVMKAGKHVIIEKPFTITSDEAKELFVVAKETENLLSVYHNRRFDSDYKTIKEILSSKVLGRLVEFESHFDRFRPEFKDQAWREEDLPGSGLLYDLGSHLIDQALALLGMPHEVYGDLMAQRKGYVDDAFEVILYYPDLKVTLKAGCLVKEPLPRFILQGTQGSFIKYGLDVQEEALKNGSKPFDATWGVEPQSLWGVLNTIHERKTYPSLRGDYRDYYKNIYGAIVHKEKLLVTGLDGFNVIKIIEAAKKSHEEKKRILL
jgi:predicted dehydrogenase